MLSRTADALFWLGRYVERADNTARIIDAAAQRIGIDAERTLVNIDRVGNTVSVSTIVEVDTSAPSAPNLAFTGLSANASYHAGQNTLYIRPSAGGTFTVTSVGNLGGLISTPIINHPEVGILGVHQIKQKPVVKDGQIVIGDVMLLSLSFDHRIVDGHVGAAFAYDIIHYLEDPDRLFLEMA